MHVKLNLSEEILSFSIFRLFVCMSVRVQTYVSHTRNNQERSSRLLWTLPKLLGLCQNSVEFDKSAWDVTKLKRVLDLFRGILTAARQLWLPSSSLIY